MRPTVYIETTIPSYLTARMSRDLIIAAHQQVTREWWHKQRAAFDLFVSQTVLNEAGRGDAEAAKERLAALSGFPLLDITTDVDSLAEQLVVDGPIPQRVAVDALHVALAAVHKMDYLLTWNCTHIANARLRGRLESVCDAGGWHCPIVCTPLELMEDLT